MEDGPVDATIDFVPAICFVPRGVAKQKPEKIVLTPAELARVIKDTKSHLESDDDAESVSSRNEGMEVDDDALVSENSNTNDEFCFKSYDNEANVLGTNIGNIVDPNQQLDDDDNDSEAEDDIIKASDNLLLVGHVQDDSASLEVWIFNEDEGSLYTHHDFLLPSFPLCIEWLSHDPGSDKVGNMCAIGCMDPIITIWDLDIQDPIEPTYKLGSIGSRRKNKPKVGHSDAVLDLSWNRHFEHIIASGSVDNTLILWDLDEGIPHTTIKAFTEKVQTVEFHSDDAQSILGGSADGIVCLFDCRDLEAINTNNVKWEISGEVEKVLWNPRNGNYFTIGTNEGNLFYVDKRKPGDFLWTTKAHSEEISGICFNRSIENLLTTTSSDGIVKIWNFNSSEIKEVYQHDFQMGRLQCMNQCPEDPFTLAFGGEKLPRCRVFNIKNFEAVRKVFEIPEESTE